MYTIKTNIKNKHCFGWNVGFKTARKIKTNFKLTNFLKKKLGGPLLQYKILTEWKRTLFFLLQLLSQDFRTV